MGNQQSSSDVISDTVNKSVTKVLISSSSTCGQSNSLTQSQVFNNIKGDTGCSVNITNVSQTANQTPNFTCSSNTSNSTDLMSQLQTQLKQQAEANIENSTLGNAEAQTTNINKIVNDISTDINISSVSSCVQDNFLKQSQGVNTISASCPSYCRDPSICVQMAPYDPKFCDMSKCAIEVSDFAQASMQGAVGNCLASNQNYQKILSESANTVSQLAKATNTGVDVSEIVTAGGNVVSGAITASGNAASGVISSSTMPFIVIGIVIVLALLVGAYFMLNGGGEQVASIVAASKA